jgi:hypothetical protein
MTRTSYYDDHPEQARRDAYHYLVNGEHLCKPCFSLLGLGLEDQFEAVPGVDECDHCGKSTEEFS